MPDLLSELGFTVISRPRRGTVQYGVDIAAVGLDDDGERKLFLFSVKQGDLTRQDWDGNPQALRPSINEILDAYIPTRIPQRYRSLKIVICLCFGGDIHEQVRTTVEGFTRKHTTKRVSFDEWNGDKLAELMLRGVLREKVLPKPMRASFRKAVAMVDEPDISYAHFAELMRQLRAAGSANARARVRAARQMNICLWMLFVWARDIGNVEAPYRASEIALLTAWDLLKPMIGRSGKDAQAMSDAIHQLAELHIRIAAQYLDKCVLPYASTMHGISSAVRSGSALDVNRKLFEVLGRVGLAGLWFAWMTTAADGTRSQPAQERLVNLCESGLQVVQNNPSLFLPISDEQATDIALFLQLWIISGRDGGLLAPWLATMANRLDLTVRTQGQYPAVFTTYRELSGHPRERTETYFQDATAGSTFIPMLAVWLRALGLVEHLGKVEALVKDKLSHCNLQLWVPDEGSEDHIYTNDDIHGRALSDLTLHDNAHELVETVRQVCKTDVSFAKLSACTTGFWPIVLVACRHYRLPVPPQFWIESLAPTP